MLVVENIGKSHKRLHWQKVLAIASLTNNETLLAKNVGNYHYVRDV